MPHSSWKRSRAPACGDLHVGLRTFLRRSVRVPHAPPLPHSAPPSRPPIPLRVACALSGLVSSGNFSAPFGPHQLGRSQSLFSPLDRAHAPRCPCPNTSNRFFIAGKRLLIATVALVAVTLPRYRYRFAVESLFMGIAPRNPGTFRLTSWIPAQAAKGGGSF